MAERNVSEDELLRRLREMPEEELEKLAPPPPLKELQDENDDKTVVTPDDLLERLKDAELEHGREQARREEQLGRPLNPKERAELFDEFGLLSKAIEAGEFKPAADADLPGRIKAGEFAFKGEPSIPDGEKVSDERQQQIRAKQRAIAQDMQAERDFDEPQRKPSEQPASRVGPSQPEPQRKPPEQPDGETRAILGKLDTIQALLISLPQRIADALGVNG